MANADVIPLEALCPGERFTRIGAPFVVYTKTSHTRARLMWKGRGTDVPMHHTTIVRRATAGQMNPGETTATPATPR